MEPVYLERPLNRVLVYPFCIQEYPIPEWRINVASLNSYPFHTAESTAVEIDSLIHSCTNILQSILHLEFSAKFSKADNKHTLPVMALVNVKSSPLILLLEV